ncbi:MAG: hypothetical protein MZV63_12245 [Marinilabiliales bacterium]|nr:hypothetical protein [Marinilabiliales bacterium]
MDTCNIPDAEISACDLEIEGVNFCAEQFGAKPIYSQEDRRKLFLKKSSI